MQQPVGKTPRVFLLLLASGTGNLHQDRQLSPKCGSHQYRDVVQWPAVLGAGRLGRGAGSR